jgi:hypothetical protein
MADLIHGRPSQEAERRIIALENEVMMLKAVQQDQTIRELERQELGDRTR